MLQNIYRAIALLLIISLSACGGEAFLETEAIPPAAGEQSEKDFEDFFPDHFTDPVTIDNPWFPLKPGTQFTYEGTSVEDGETLSHKIVIIVTDLTKVIGGVRALVTWDRDYSQDELVEAELAFYAQDETGTVWRMGEYPEEYENGEFIQAPAWTHGLQDARAGIAMPADPQLKTPSFSEGWGPAVGWNDRGQVDQTGKEICVPFKCYQDVLVIAETSKSEPGAVQLKFYAPGTGNIRTDWRGSDATQEKLELTALVQLEPEALAEARVEALQLESHAYQVSTDMYVHTLPAEYPQGTPAIQVQVVPTPSPAASLPGGPPQEIVVYAADLPQNALSEFEFMDDPDSPGGRLVGLPNEGDELDPPPENDPHATFKISVHSQTPYRCWIHMKVGTPKGKSKANKFWIQFSGAVDNANNEIFAPGTDSFLTAQGPMQTGWVWVGCNLEGADGLIYFKTSGEVTVRMQAGMEGVGFDQFLLSPARFLENPPSEVVVEKIKKGDQ